MWKTGKESQIWEPQLAEFRHQAADYHYQEEGMRKVDRKPFKYPGWSS
jgi:hypothetical protein